MVFFDCFRHVHRNNAGVTRVRYFRIFLVWIVTLRTPPIAVIPNLSFGNIMPLQCFAITYICTLAGNKSRRQKRVFVISKYKTNPKPKNAAGVLCISISEMSMLNSGVGVPDLYTRESVPHRLARSAKEGGSETNFKIFGLTEHVSGSRRNILFERNVSAKFVSRTTLVSALYNAYE